MSSTLKITKKPEISNETLWPPCGWSFTITVETKTVTFMTAACRTGSVANAGVQKQAINQHLLPFCGPGRGHSALTGHALALPAENGNTSSCYLLLNNRSSQRNHSADDQLTVSSFTVECFDRELSRRQTRQEATDKQPGQTDGKL